MEDPEKEVFGFDLEGQLIPPLKGVCYYPYWRDFFVRAEMYMGKSENGLLYGCFRRQGLTRHTCKIMHDNTQSRQEAEMYLFLKHPYIVDLQYVYFNSIQNQRKMVLIFETPAGGDLYDRIIRRPIQPITEARIGEITSMLIEALVYLSTLKICHLNLLPYNIWLTERSDSATIKLTDLCTAEAYYGRGSVPKEEIRAQGLRVIQQESGIKGRYAQKHDLWCLGHIVYLMVAAYPAGGPCKAATDVERREEFNNFRLAMDCQETFRFPLKDWINVSPQCVEFVDGLINNVVKRQVTIHVCAKDRWLTEVAPKRTTPLWQWAEVTVEQVEKYRMRKLVIADARPVLEQSGMADLLPLIQSTAGREIRSSDLDQSQDCTRGMANTSMMSATKSKGRSSTCREESRESIYSNVSRSEKSRSQRKFAQLMATTQSRTFSMGTQPPSPDAQQDDQCCLSDQLAPAAQTLDQGTSVSKFPKHTKKDLPSKEQLNPKKQSDCAENSAANQTEPAQTSRESTDETTAAGCEEGRKEKPAKGENAGEITLFHEDPEKEEKGDQHENIWLKCGALEELVNYLEERGDESKSEDNTEMSSIQSCVAYEIVRL